MTRKRRTFSPEFKQETASSTLTSMLKERGVAIGRFKVRRLMGELGLVCKQPGPHTFNGGISPVVAEEKLNILSGIS